MKWICPVCQKENEDSWKCDCGFDESRNYEKYRVMQLLSKEDIQNYMNQKGNKDRFYEMYKKSISISCLQRAAELGNPQAQYELGKLYFDGILEQNFEMAFDWWRCAMEGDKDNILKNKLGFEYIRKFQELEKVKGELEKTREKLEQLQENKKKTREVQIGDIIEFGKNNREWIVLDRQGFKALIITKGVVGKRNYNEIWEDITWEECSLRAWLNGEFLIQNFSMEESDRIAVTLVKNLDNPEYGTNGGRDTQDKIFCLSIEEAKRYFKDNEARAIGFGWWLRSSGDCSYRACDVFSNGKVGQRGNNVVDWELVRPALWLNLESY